MCRDLTGSERASSKNYDAPRSIRFSSPVSSRNYASLAAGSVRTRRRALLAHILIPYFSGGHYRNYRYSSDQFLLGKRNYKVFYNSPEVTALARGGTSNRSRRWRSERGAHRSRRERNRVPPPPVAQQRERGGFFGNPLENWRPLQSSSV